MFVGPINKFRPKNFGPKKDFGRNIFMDFENGVIVKIYKS